jgi:hypothetical protein
VEENGCVTSNLVCLAGFLYSDTPFLAPVAVRNRNGVPSKRVRYLIVLKAIFVSGFLLDNVRVCGISGTHSRCSKGMYSGSLLVRRLGEKK